MLTMLNNPTSLTSIASGAELTAVTFADVRRRLLDAIADGTERLVIDCRALERIDVHGIGLLIATHNTLAEAGATLALSELHGEPAEILRFLRLERTFEILPQAIHRGATTPNTRSGR